MYHTKNRVCLIFFLLIPEMDQERLLQSLGSSARHTNDDAVSRRRKKKVEFHRIDDTSFK